MILTKRKLDRAENQLVYVKRTVIIVEYHNKKYITVRTVKMLLKTHGQELEGSSLEKVSAELETETESSESKHSNCTIQ